MYDPQTRQKIRKLAEKLTLQGKTHQQIVDILNEQNIRQDNDKKWKVGNLRAFIFQCRKHGEWEGLEPEQIDPAERQAVAKKTQTQSNLYVLVERDKRIRSILKSHTSAQDKVEEIKDVYKGKAS